MEIYYLDNGAFPDLILVAMEDPEICRISPEKDLMVHVLKTAVCDLFVKNDKEREKAERWFESSDLDYLYSFRRICQELDLDPEYILSEIKLLGNRPKIRFRTVV